MASSKVASARDRRSVGECELGNHEQPGRGDHLALRGARALEREGREDVCRDETLEHHDLLLLQRRKERATSLSDQVDNVAHLRDTKR